MGIRFKHRSDFSSDLGGFTIVPRKAAARVRATVAATMTNDEVGTQTRNSGSKLKEESATNLKIVHHMMFLVNQHLIPSKLSLRTLFQCRVSPPFQPSTSNPLQ